MHSPASSCLHPYLYSRIERCTSILVQSSYGAGRREESRAEKQAPGETSPNEPSQPWMSLPTWAILLASGPSSAGPKRACRRAETGVAAPPGLDGIMPISLLECEALILSDPKPIAC